MFEQYNNLLLGDNYTGCEVHWDRLSCWPRTLPGAWANISCFASLHGVQYDITRNASRYCREDGTWENISDYTDCRHVPDTSIIEDGEAIELPTIIYYTGYSISLIALTLAVIVFIYFKELRCLRNTIHTNLFCTYIMSALLWMLTLQFQMSQSPGLLECIILMTSFHYFSLTNFFWMLVEGLYLYTLVVETFSGELNLKFNSYATIGYGIPGAIVVIWSVVKGVTSELGKNELPEDEMMHLQCSWMRESSADWIFQGPACAVLIINLVFLIRIMWVLITKLRSANTIETKQYRKAAKALLVLIPLFGITYLVVLSGPNEGVGSYIFACARALLLSTQGFFVSLFYCFLNSEVRLAVKHRYNTWADERNISKGQLKQRESRRYLKNCNIKEPSPRSRTESLRPLTYIKRESSVSSATTTTLIGHGYYRGSNGALHMHSMPRTISPLMQGLDENSV